MKKSHSIILLASASLALGALSLSSVAQETKPADATGTMSSPAMTTAKPSDEMAAKEMVAKGKLDENGAAMTPGARVMLKAAPAAMMPPLTEICLKITNPQTPSLTWYANAHGVISGPNFNIVNGTLHGTICSGQWHLTGGTLGITSETVMASINAPTSYCASSVKLTGSASGFFAYTGHYGFNTTSPNAFNQKTTIVGVNIANCP